MEISSKTLQGAFSINSVEKTTYGRKQIDGYWHDNEPVGTERALDLTIGFKPDCDRTMLNAALAVSPREACLKHMNHLMQHKNMGMNEMQASIKLKDYVEALMNFPEWVMWMVCKNLIINSKGGFVPCIAEMKDACGLVQAALERQRANMGVLVAPARPQRVDEPTRKEKPQELWTPEEWRDWIEDAEKMVDIAKKNPQFFSIDDWRQELERRNVKAQPYINPVENSSKGL